MPELYEPEEFAFGKVPLRVYLHHLEGLDIYTILHWHLNIEFALTTRGRILSTIGLETRVVEAGDWSLVNSGILHTNHWVSRDDLYEGTVVQIGKSFLDTWLGKDLILEEPKEKEKRDKMARGIETIGRAVSENQDDLEQMEALFRFLQIMKECCSAVRITDKTEQKTIHQIREILSYIDAHFMEEIDLSRVAKHLHYTPEHLSRMFKKNTGFTFHQYVQHTRLMHCLNRMQEDPDIKLLDCAVENGFPNAKSFIQTFKSNFQCTPSEWMKHRKGMAGSDEA